MNLVKSIGVVGCGTVGHAVVRGWTEYCGAMHVYDRDEDKRTSGLERTVNSDVVFVCLPESELDEFFELVSSVVGFDELESLFVIKSTVQVGTCRRYAAQYPCMRLLHSPEFLTERCAVADYLTPSRLLVGATDETAEGWHDADWLRNLYSTRFPGVPIYWNKAEYTELVKLVCNAFFAVKLSFFNEVHEICRKEQLAYPSVLEAVLADGRISHSHTRVPGPDGRAGFGGKCLPKDAAMLLDLTNELGTPNNVIGGALETNYQVRGSKDDTDHYVDVWDDSGVPARLSAEAAGSDTRELQERVPK